MHSLPRSAFPADHSVIVTCVHPKLSTDCCRCDRQTQCTRCMSGLQHCSRWTFSTAGAAGDQSVARTRTPLGALKVSWVSSCMGTAQHSTDAYLFELVEFLLLKASGRQLPCAVPRKLSEPVLSAAQVLTVCCCTVCCCIYMKSQQTLHAAWWNSSCCLSWTRHSCRGIIALPQPLIPSYTACHPTNQPN